MPTLEEAERQAREVINSWAAGVLVTSWIPASSFGFAGTGWAMMLRIANIFDVKEYDKEALVSAVSKCMAGMATAELFGFIPVIGMIVKASVAHSITKSVGDTVIDFFRERSPLSSEEK